MLTRIIAPIFYFSAALGALALIASMILPGEFVSPALPALIPFFMSVTILSFHFLQKALNRKFIRFVNTFLLSIILKLFLYMIIMVAYALLYRSDAVPFLLSFFVFYLLYTVFESVYIIKFSRKPESGT